VVEDAIDAGVIQPTASKAACERSAVSGSDPAKYSTVVAWADAAYRNKPAEKAADAAWTSAYNFPKEDQEPEHQLVLGAVMRFDRVVAQAGAPSRRGRGRLGAFRDHPFWPARPPALGRPR